MKSQLRPGTESKAALHSRTGSAWARAESRQTREQTPGLIVEQVIFTAREHLGAQEQIERRAHELWCAGGCRHDTALKDWLQAEREILEQFIWAYARRHALRHFAKTGTSPVVARKETETSGFLSWP